jgi:hypothetical protein
MNLPMPSLVRGGSLTNRETIELFDAEVAASGAALSQSKNVKQSASEDLKQHERWLRHHAAAEARNREKHERRLKQLRISQRRWVKRQRFLRSVRERALIIGVAAKRQALIVGAAAHSIAVASSQKAISAANYTQDQISSAVAWSRPRLKAASDMSYQAGEAGYAWLNVKAIGTAAQLSKAGNAGYAWLKVKAADSSVRLSKASKAAASRGQAVGKKLSQRRAAGLKTLNAKSRAWASRVSEQGNAASTWSRTQLGVRSRSVSHAASIGFEQAKRKSGKFAQSASALTAATAVRARDYGHQAVASAKSWSEKTVEGAQQLRESLAARATVSDLQTPQAPSAAPDKPTPAAQEPEQRSVIDLLNIAPRHDTPAREKPASEPIDIQPRALAASALSRPSPPRHNPKPDKIKATDKTHRGGRGGKKKHKQKHAKSKSK